MQKTTEKSVNAPLLGILGLIALGGLVQAASIKAGPNLAHVVGIVLNVLASFGAFVW